LENGGEDDYLDHRIGHAGRGTGDGKVDSI